MWTSSSIEESQKHPEATFLLAAWHELFHAFTPDSWQPRLHNVSSLVEELVDMARRWKQQPKFQHQVEKITAELKTVIREEEDLLEKVPAYRTTLLSLCEAQAPDSLIAKGHVALDGHENYCAAFRRSAEEAIANLPRRKKNAFRSVRRLATLAMQAGKEDDDVWTPLDKDVSRTPSIIFKDLTELSTAHSRSYECTLTVLGDTGPMHSISRKQGLSIVSADSLPKDYISSLSLGRNNSLHVQRTIEARSIRSAVTTARTQLELQMGLVSLYANPACLRLHGDAFVRCDGRSHTFVQSEQAFRRLYPRAKAKIEVNEAIELLESHAIDRRVLSAIRQLSLASASADTRTKFVNLWASLETLAGAHEGETAMERVSELIVPLVVSRSIHRATRYLTILTQRFGDDVGRYELGVGLRNNGMRGIRLDDMLVTLTSPNRHPNIMELLRFADHPLLRFRIYTTWERFHDPKTLLARLEASRQRLQWQLARIYRARNLLVHEGEEVDFIDPLLDNLQNYLSMLVQRILHELKTHPQWGVRELIEFWRGRMNHSLNSLKVSPSILTARDFLEVGDPLPLWQV